MRWSGLLAAGLLLASQPVRAQRVCLGVLTDSLRAPLPGASVYLTAPGSPAGLVYTTTDPTGHFQLALPPSAPDTLLLQVRLMGFRPLVRQLVPAGRARTKLTLQLRPAPTTLREVVVQGQRLGIHYNDTTSFEARHYTNGTQRNLEDVLKNVPGFAVSPEGQITYKGTAIAGIYLDGDNLTGANYQRLARSLDASLVGKIQPIERFVENRLLGGLVRSETTVLNISLPDDRKKPLFGSLDAEGNLAGYRDVLANVFSYRKRSKFYFIGTHNNVGLTKDPIAESLTSPTSTALRQEVVAARPLLAAPPLAARDFKPELSTLNNETAGGLITVLSPESKRWKLLSDLSVYHNRLHQTRRSDTRYLVDERDSTFSRFREADYARQTVTSLRLRTNFFATLTPTTNFVYEHRLKLGRTRFQDSLRLTTQARQQVSTEAIGQHLGSEAVQFGQNAIFTKRLSATSALQAQALHTYDYLPTQFDLGFDSPARQAAYLGPPLTGQLRQQANATQEALNVEVEYFQTKYPVNYTLVVGSRLATTRLATRLLPLLASGAEGSPAYTSLLALRQAHLYATLKFDRTVGHFNLSGAVGLVGLRLATEGPAELLRRLVVPSGRLVGQYAVSARSFLQLSYAFEQELPSAADLLRPAILVDYRAFYQGAATILTQPTHRVALTFAHQNLATLTEVRASVQLSRRGASYGQQLQLGKYVSRTVLFVAPATHQAAGQLTAAKFIASLSLRVQVESTGNFLESYTQLHADSLRLNRLLFARNRLQLGTSFDGPVNFFGGASLLTNILRSKGDGSTLASTNNRVQADLQAVYRRKKLTTSLRADLLFVNRTSYYFLSGETTFAPAASRFAYSLVLRNLLNTQSFTQIFYTSLAASTTSYELLPRLIMPGINYRF